jgi:hypothetical protein
MAQPMLLAFANLPQPGLVPPATSREGRRRQDQTGKTKFSHPMAKGDSVVSLQLYDVERK